MMRDSLVRCVNVMLEAKTWATATHVLEAADVPLAERGAVGVALMSSKFVAVRENGMLQHVWVSAGAALREAAVHETDVFAWAKTAGVKAPVLFMQHVAATLDALGLHSRSPGVVRQTTSLNIYDSHGMCVALKRAGLAGVARWAVLAEYPEAFTDIQHLYKTGQVHVSPERLWAV